MAKTFLMISAVVGVTSDAQDIFNEITLRTQAPCELFLVDSLEEANDLAFQRYGISFYGVQRDNNARPMSLAISGEYLLTTDESLLPATQRQACGSTGYIPQLPIDWGGAWAVIGINGFGIRYDIGDVLNIFLHSDLIYPMARWYPTPQLAIAQAYATYSRRFFTRYNGKNAYPVMPNVDSLNNDCWLFIDKNFERREEERQDNAVLSKLGSLGLMV